MSYLNERNHLTKKKTPLFLLSRMKGNKMDRWGSFTFILLYEDTLGLHIVEKKLYIHIVNNSLHTQKSMVSLF